MPNSIRLDEWLGFIDAEYLTTFIKEGGGSIKFVVAEDGLRPALHEAMERRCRELDYLVVKLDAANMRAHMLQDVFFKMAEQVDWRHLSRRLILRFAREVATRSIPLISVQQKTSSQSIGEANGNLDPGFVLNELRRKIQDGVFKEYRMVKDFRVAMSHLCQGEESSQPLIDWLTGKNTRVSSVRPFSIYTPINRTTGRHFIQSALFWFQYVGHAGTVILLDNSRVTIPRRPKDKRDYRYYTRPMAMDHYEILREFIDSTDQLCGAFLVIGDE